MTLVKICGLTTIPDLDAAIEAGADFVGFVHFEKSPRHVSESTLEVLFDHLPYANKRYGRRALGVGLVVDPCDNILDVLSILEPDVVQFHGNERPERIVWARKAYIEQAVTIKATPVSQHRDLDTVLEYLDCVEHVMLDARPPKDSSRPGGHGVPLDWSVIANSPKPVWPGGPARTRRRGLPDDDRLWFLAGGLTPANVGEALRVTRAPAVDVSSGVESAPGVKDPALIAAFIQAVRAHDALQETP